MLSWKAMSQPKPPSKPESALIQVRVIPRSSQNKIALLDGCLKIWVTSPPVDGAANEAVCAILAKSLGIAPSRVQVVRGETSKDKLLRVEGLTLEYVLERVCE